MKTKTDPATWREAARQLREEAELVGDPDAPCDAAWHLESMARRFESEATAAEQTDCNAQEQAERRVYAAADAFERDVEAHMERVAKLKAKGEANG